MTETSESVPLREIPRSSFADAARNFLNSMGRVDMRSSLQRLHARYGNAVNHRAGRMDMVNLFGPDANRLVLLDRDGIFSARKAPSGPIATSHSSCFTRLWSWSRSMRSTRKRSIEWRICSRAAA